MSGNSRISFLIGSADAKKRQDMIDTIHEILSSDLNKQNKILLCTYNPLLKVQLNQHFRVNLFSKNKISVVTYNELFNLLLNRTDKSKIPLNKSLEIINSGVDLENVRKRFPNFTHIFFDQAEFLLNAFPHFLEVLPEDSKNAISITLPESDLDSLSKFFIESFGESSVKAYKEDHSSDRNSIITIDDIDDLIFEWKNFLNISIESTRRNDFRWPRAVILEFSNERYRRSISSKIEKMLFRNGLNTVWSYNSVSYPNTDFDLYIITKPQSLGIDFKARLVISSYGDANKRKDPEPDSTNLMVLIDHANVFDILVKNKNDYRFYFNGREIFIKDSNFNGNFNEWWVEARMGVGELRIVPFEITAEQIHNIKKK